MNNFWWWVRFDRRISGVGSNCSANWATTKSPSMTCFSSRASNYGILAIKPIVMNVYRFKTKRLTLKWGKTQNTHKHKSPSWIFLLRSDLVQQKPFLWRETRDTDWKDQHKFHRTDFSWWDFKWALAIIEHRNCFFLKGCPTPLDLLKPTAHHWLRTRS